MTHASDHRWESIREATPLILPSLLLCDFGNLQREIERLEAADVRALHLDVMDGQFVPNMTYGMTIVRAVRKLTRLPLDVHLMIEHPENYLQAFRDAGADLITIHAEAVADPRPLLRQIRGLGAGSGLAIVPDTPVDRIGDCLNDCDLVLAMSVDAGFGAQQFNPIALEKLADLRSRGYDRLLQVDGGINSSTIADCARAGADLFVVGSAIFRSADYGATVRELRQLAQSA